MLGNTVISPNSQCSSTATRRAGPHGGGGAGGANTTVARAISYKIFSVRSRPMPEPSRPPLAGITVVALEQAVAAPFATRQLADLGARVIKLERPGAGDFARGYDSSVRGESSYFAWLNRGKESVTLDLK